MSSVKVANMLSVLKPLHFQAQMFGLTSFSIQRDKTFGYRCHVSIFNAAILVLSTLWYIHGIYFVTAAKELYETDEDSGLSRFIGSCVSVILVANCVTMIFSIWWFFIIKSKFVPIFNKMDEVDDVLESLGSQVDHAKDRRYLCYTLAIQNIFLTTVTIFAYLSAYFNNFYKPNIFTSIAEFIGFQYIHLLHVHFNFFMLSVRKRYQHINGLLKNSARSEIVDVEFYQKLAILHDKLVDISDKVNFCFGIPVSVEDFGNSSAHNSRGLVLVFPCIVNSSMRFIKV